MLSGARLGEQTRPEAALPAPSSLLTPPPFRYNRPPPPGLGPDSFERDSLPARMSASALHGRVKELLEQIADVDRCVSAWVCVCVLSFLITHRQSLRGSW
jgi:hypothetical protein